MSFQENLKKLMSAKGVNAREVSKATGIPRSTLNEWQNGMAPNLNERLIGLAKYFNVSVEFMVMGRESEERIIKDIVSEIEGHFTKVHTGVYRVSIEKLNKPS